MNHWSNRHRAVLVAGLLGAAVASGAMGAQPPGEPEAAATPVAPRAADRVAEAIPRCVEFLLSVQEGDDRAEWPYEGVYRVRGKIPIGYRIGGTSMVATALLRAPGFDEDQSRVEAVDRALGFVFHALADPLMNPDYAGGYDVRGWGYTYALTFMLALKDSGAAARVDEGLRDRLDERIRWCIAAIEQTEIPESGGWNYARTRGKDAVSPSSPFMTGPTLLALFDARRQGFAVDAGVVERGLKSLERARAASGSVAYSGDAGRRAEKVPGAVGRMLICEITLLLGGGDRSDLARLRGAIDAFLVHWDWLDRRRAKTGTHEGPYGIAPYYFYYAHQAAAQAIEMLPVADRAEYRRRLLDKLFSVQLENGAWNDRVFDRTANYGTSQALMCLMAPALPTPSPWSVPAPEGSK